MAPITSEGNSDYEKIVLIVTGKSDKSAHPILSKYCIESEDDFVNALSSLVPHPIALAFQFHRRNMKGQQYKKDVLRRYHICQYVREYAKFMLVDSIGVAQTELTRDKLIRQNKSHRKANTFWNNNISTCILCKRVTMKMYTDAFKWKKCAECKGWVCPYCDCQQYHLSHLATLLGTLETGQTVQNQNKMLPKKRKQKHKRVKKPALGPTMSNFVPEIEKNLSRCSAVSSANLDPDNISVKSSHNAMPVSKYSSVKQDRVPPEERIDFVQYLQETKSMIALSHLMEDLESTGYDFDGKPFEPVIVGNE